MADEAQDVNAVEPSATENEVVKEEVGQTTTPEETTTQEVTGQPQEESKPQQFSPVDEKGVPWVNRYHESERKSRELLENLETKMGEILSKQNTQSQPKEYTISEIEKFAMENPEHRPWAEEQKARLIGKEIARITEEKVKEVEVKQRSENIRNQSVNWAFNHPRLQECFMQDPYGNKVWNNEHPLTRMIGANLNDPDLKRRPDALVIATKLALSDYMDSQINTTQKKVKTLQQNLKKVQKATMSEGGGTNATKSVKDEFTKAKELLMSKSGNKDAAGLAVKAYLKKYGVIQE